MLIAAVRITFVRLNNSNNLNLKQMKKTTSKFNWLHSLVFVMLLMAIAISTDAQTADKRWNIGLHAGAGQYNGDLGNDFYKMDMAFYGFGGLSITRYLGNRLDVTLAATKGEIGYLEGASHFRQEMSTATINFRFNILGEKSFFRPYIFAGGGVMMFVNDFAAEKTSDYDFAAPSFGAGLNIRLGKAVMLNLNETFIYSTSDKRDGVELNSNDAFLMHSVGLTFNFGKKQDADNDGVADRKDKCPDTPEGVAVDAVGCPFDSDMDGVVDHLDKCQNTPENVLVDKTGCPLDTDQDGVADYLDKCPNTPSKALVDATGCPIDTDNDGVADYLDNCPNSPANARVDQNGCPLDEDNDKVPDYTDNCPNTPKGATVDEFGCTLDTDKDGVPDYLDKCPTIAGTAENKGCPVITKEVEILFQKALQGIKFDTGKSTIKAVSNPILDAVVKVMYDNPSYKLIIGGHTDNVGGESMNMTLSKNRADAVSNYLIAKGVSPTRISSSGYGYSMPVDDNATVAGRTRNRRVELSVEFIEVVEVEK